MNEFIVSIILGIVEGLTEFLPISSTGHLILVNQVLSFTGRFANMFDVVIQFGAILSVVGYFWNRLYPFSKNKSISERQKIMTLWQKTIVGVIPALVIGGALGSHVEELLFNPLVVAIALLVGGILLIVIENRSKKSIINSIDHLSYKTAFLIGIIQCIAMIPGTSRSAATIIGAMLLGTSRIVAAEFSFFLAVPTMAAATAYSLLKTGLTLNAHELQVLAVGFIVSFIVAWIVIAGFMNYITKRDFKPFGYYRIILGVLILAYFGFMK